MSKWLVVKAGFRTSKSNQQNLILEQIGSESTIDFSKKNLEKVTTLLKSYFQRSLTTYAKNIVGKEILLENVMIK